MDTGENRTYKTENRKTKIIVSTKPYQNLFTSSAVEMMMDIHEQLSHSRSVGFLICVFFIFFWQRNPRTLTFLRSPKPLSRRSTARPVRIRGPVRTTYRAGISAQPPKGARDSSTGVAKATVTTTSLRNCVWKPARVNSLLFSCSQHWVLIAPLVSRICS